METSVSDYGRVHAIREAISRIQATDQPCLGINHDVEIASVALLISSAIFSASIYTVDYGCPGGVKGAADISTALSLSTPNTLAYESTTALESPRFPIAQVAAA